MTPAANAAQARDLLAGATGAVVTLALVVSLGILAYAPLGADAAAVGLASAFMATMVSVTVFGLLARCAMPTGGPSTATAIILAGLVAQVLASQPASTDGTTRTLAVIAACSAAVVLMGLLQMAMAGLRLGRLVGYVQQTAMSGFMNGVALLVLLSQLPALLAINIDVWRAGPWHALAHAQTGAAVLGIAVAWCSWWLARRSPTWPAALIALLLGCAAYHAVRAAWPALALGPTLGPVPATLPGGAWPPPLAQRGLWPVLLTTAPAIGITGLLLALIGTLEGMLTLRAIDQQLGMRADEDRALLANGLANVVGGLFAALPVTVSRNKALAIAHAGGQGRVPALFSVAVAGALLLLVANGIAQVPRTALAGVMLIFGLALADTWSSDMLRRLLRDHNSTAMRQSLAVVLLVCLMTVVWGTVAGVAAGVVLASASFVRGLQISVLRARYDASTCTSRRVWPARQEQVLQPLRRHILVLELEGALFFGNAQRVADAVDALPAGYRFVVLDLRRVSAIDESCATMLRQIEQRLGVRGTRLLLAAVTPQRLHGQRLLAFGTHDAGGRWHADVDHAMEAAERQLLTDAALPPDLPPPPLAHSSLLQGLSDDDADHVSARMPARVLAAGECLFREGDPADGLYIVASGSVSVLSASTAQRFVSFSAGTMFGETALFDGGGRTADAVADEPTEVRQLTLGVLDALLIERPELAAHLYRNIVRHGAQRLRHASLAWRQAAT